MLFTPAAMFCRYALQFLLCSLTLQQPAVGGTWQHSCLEAAAGPVAARAAAMPTHWTRVSPVALQPKQPCWQLERQQALTNTQRQLPAVHLTGLASASAVVLRTLLSPICGRQLQRDGHYQQQAAVAANRGVCRKGLRSSGCLKLQERLHLHNCQR